MMLHALALVFALQAIPAPRPASDPAPPPRSAATLPPQPRADADSQRIQRRSATSPKAQTASLSEKLFGPGWVVFSARVVLVTIFLALGVTMGSGGLWIGYRLAHTVKHTDWNEPPRRLKRGEFGAAGATIAVEWEDRLVANQRLDEERDQQIAALWDAVRRLDERCDGLGAGVDLLRRDEIRKGDTDGDDQG